MRFLAVVMALLTTSVLLAADGGQQEIKTVLFPFRETVVSARLESVLKNYKFLQGQPFKAGDTLVELDDSRYAIELARTTEQLRFAKSTYEEKKELREKKYTSDAELRKAEYDFHLTEISCAEAKLNVSFCTIKAPFDGKIVEIMTHDFETTRSGQTLCRIIDDNQLLAVMNVPLTDRALTTIGTTVKIRLDQKEATATGTIYEVSPQADHRTGTVRIRVLIDNRQGLFFAGMTGTLQK
ncbi:MAG: efflux RND transporter periplasmic adaptor subunit [Victivallales bacterium]|nr:efflux RND transporter periplasmic adaptor subunit [Victivallales bacterium]